MRGVVLPGDSTVAFREVEMPAPGHGQVRLRMRASSICGSDIRAIYREHLGTGPERYRGVIAGHEPSGEVVDVGPGCRRLRRGDRVTVYHIAGCGLCEQCRRGYPVGCESEERAAYGWQRDGGHAPYLLAEELSCLPLADELSFVDGALIACGFGTAYEALLRLALSGRDRLLVCGLGPVGLAVAMLGRALGAAQVIGAEIAPPRLRFAADSGLFDQVVDAGDGREEVLRLTGGRGCEATVDCSGSAPGRLLALDATRRWGRCAFVGEGGDVTIDVSQALIHRQLTLFGSWVTSPRHMQELIELLARRRLHPEATVAHRLPLERAAEAYELADAGAPGKVCIVWE
jgi:threonine dehydrogenase-like Zn-dependent dehydrogenase